MRTTFFAILLFLSGILTNSAYAGGPDPRTLTHDFGFTAGVMSPLKDKTDPEVIFGINYSTFMESGVGFRFGLQMSPEYTKTASVVGAPAAIVIRSRERSTQERLVSGAYGAAGALMNGVIHRRDDIGENMLAAALVALFSGAEYYAGITPGIISDSSSNLIDDYTQSTRTKYIDSSSPVYLTADAGMNLSYALWRFDVKFMPAIHYNLLGNYKLVTSSTSTSDSYYYSYKDVRWLFSFCMGLSLRF